MTGYLGLDIGATNLRCALATADLEPVARVSRPTPQGPDVESFVTGVEDAIAAVFESATVAREAVEAAGIASFGPLDADGGLIRQTPNLDSDLQDVPIRATVADCFPCTDPPVRLCNDAVAGVLAEYHDDPTANLAYVTLSTGIGAGVVVDGNLLHGTDGNAAEMGHVTLDPDSSRPCGCGGRGHWEAFAGGGNVPGYAADIAASEGLDDALLTGECTAATIFDACGEDPLATETVERLGDWNALGMAAVVHAFDPARIAVGGAVAQNNERLVLEPIRTRIDQHVVDSAPDIRLTPLGDEVGLRGALLLAAGAEPGTGTAATDGTRAGAKRADF